MARLHMRNGTLILKDGNGRSLEIRVLDWTVEYGPYPPLPVITAVVAPDAPWHELGKEG